MGNMYARCCADIEEYQDLCHGTLSMDAYSVLGATLSSEGIIQHTDGTAWLSCMSKYPAYMIEWMEGVCESAMC